MVSKVDNCWYCSHPMFIGSDGFGKCDDCGATTTPALSKRYALKLRKVKAANVTRVIMGGK